MQSLTFKRYIIWGALAAVSYLMLLQWDKDYGSQVNLESTQAINDKKVEGSRKEIEDSSDLPTVEEKSNQITEENLVSGSQSILISNKTIEITIDLLGGDITNVDLLEHAVDIDHPESVVSLLENNQTRVYVAQSGLIGKNGPDAYEDGRPQYQAEKEKFLIDEKEKKIVVPIYFSDSSGNEIKKLFTLEKGSYQVHVEYEITNNQETAWEGNLFAQIKRDNTEDPLANKTTFGMNPFLGIAYWSQESKYNKVAINDIKDEPVKITHQGGWLAFVQHYFLSAWIAPTETKNTYSTRVNKRGENILGFLTERIIVEPKGNKNIQFSFYAGPKDQYKLREISSGLELTVDYGWLWMVAQAIFWFLIRIQEHVINWGWSIVVLTCFIKAIFFPLNQYAFKSMANMRKLQPKMQKLKELYGDDRQKLSQATMEMYRKEKINPLGSCLPMLIQMPVFIALYWVLSESVEIRHAEFIFWIKDLSIKDPYFVLPALMAISMFIQQKLSPMVFQDPTQEKIMKMMPFLFAVFFLFFPAGLVLYWLVNNILTILQQWVINKQLEANEK